MTTHVMLDLETMSTKSNAAIVAIGAVQFCYKTKTLGKEFYQTIKLKSCQDLGLHIDAGTVMWWLGQSTEARRELNEVWTLQEVLLDFQSWLPTGALVWGNGSNFDNVILRNAYDTALIDCPWSHRNNRCYRTLKAELNLPRAERIGTYHKAIDDAKNQATHCIELLRRLHRLDS